MCKKDALCWIGGLGGGGGTRDTGDQFACTSTSCGVWLSCIIAGTVEGGSVIESGVIAEILYHGLFVDLVAILLSI